MTDAYSALNDVLVNIFNKIISIEEKAVITGDFVDISVNDMHIIKAVGVDKPKNMSTIAKELSVTVGTLTIAINSLVKKGYVIKKRSEKDRRVVYIHLSEKGIKAYEYHNKFHNDMIESIIKEFEGKDEELEILIKLLSKLVGFFDEKSS